MAIPKKLLKFLEKNKVKCEVLEHRTVFTAKDKSKTLRVPEKVVAKTLVVKLDKNVALVSVPANKNLDKEKLKKAAKAKKIDFVKEPWMKKNLKGFKPGAIPPFGNIWGLATFVDKALTAPSKVIANGGVNNFSLRLSPKELKKAAPDLIVGNFGQARA